MKPIVAVPALGLLLVRAYGRRSLTTGGLVAAALTGIIHALYPSGLAFTLLGVFFLLGTQATRVKHDVKAELTLQPRTATQVLANSAAASILCLVHIWRYGIDGSATTTAYGQDRLADALLVGIVSNYVSVTADTLSSELGILSAAAPRLITDPLRTVPRGTNGGVTLLGVWYGYVGSLLASVIDRRTGKIVEAAGGAKEVELKQEHHPSRQINTGRDILDNNQVNFLMASTMTIWGMIVAASL
ncbi:hypothetical protein DV735_g83, partial [Chaetothyriales sp. CBS 134920]